MIPALAVFLVPALSMFVITRALTPSMPSTRSLLVFQLTIGAGLGLGLSSCFFFLWRVAFGHPGAMYIIAESVLSALAAAAFRFHGRRRTPQLIPASSRPPLFFLVVFFVALGAALFCFMIQSRHVEHGEWDAWANFDLRARILFLAEGPRDAFLQALNTWPVSDYPLLVPGLVARAWTIAGVDTPEAAILVAAIFMVGTVALLTVSLAMLRSESQGLMGGTLLLCTRLFVIMSASQYADVPLGFFMLASLALFALHDRYFAGNDGVLVLAGCAAGLAAWTKNDGILFMVVLVAVRLVFLVWTDSPAVWRRQMLAVVAGLAPFVLLLIWFKVDLVPPSELLRMGATGTWQRATDLSRSLETVATFVKEWLRFGPWAPVDLIPLLLLWLLFVGPDVRSAVRFRFAAPPVVVFLTTAGYAMVCVLSPYNIKWQLGTALFRLQLQLWPSVIWAGLLLAKPLDSAAEDISQKEFR